MPELYFFQNVPSDASPEWRRLFELMDADIASSDSLLGRPAELVRKQRLDQLENCGTTNEFDAVLSAVAQKDMGNTYFRQGNIGKAQSMYFTALIVAPLPSVLSNLAAVLLQQGMYLGAQGFCTRLLAMRECLSDDMIAKAYYRRSIARRLLDHKGNLLQEALADAETALKFAPTNVDIANELKKVTEMLKMSKLSVMRLIQKQRNTETPPLTQKMVMTDADARESARDARVKCTKRFTATFDYRIERPPGWKC